MKPLREKTANKQNKPHKSNTNSETTKDNVRQNGTKHPRRNSATYIPTSYGFAFLEAGDFTGVLDALDGKPFSAPIASIKSENPLPCFFSIA